MEAMVLTVLKGQKYNIWYLATLSTGLTLGMSHNLKSISPNKSLTITKNVQIIWTFSGFVSLQFNIRYSNYFNAAL